MKILKIKVSGQSVVWENPFDIVAGCREYLGCEFSFSEDWENTDKAVRFYQITDKKFYGFEHIDGVVTVPAEVIKGRAFYIAVGGYGDGGIFIPTSAVKIKLQPNGYGEPDEDVLPGEDYESALAELLKLAGECRDACIEMRYAPYIHENGNWYLYNRETEMYEDSGICARGLSAYEIAKTYGFEGTEEEWLESLKAEAVQVDSQMSDDSTDPVQNKVVKAYVDEGIRNHNTADGSHNDIRIAIVELSKRLNAVADSEDVDLDQLSEIIAYIKSNKGLIDSITTSKVSVTDIIDNLTTNVGDKPLSAKQGVELKKLIDTLNTFVSETYKSLQGGTSTAYDVAINAFQNAETAQITADDAKTRAVSAQSKADSAYSVATSAGSLALNAKTTAEDALGALENKQDKVEICTDDVGSSIIFNALEYHNCDYRALISPNAIAFEFPNEEYPSDYTTGLSFYSGDTPPTISYATGEIIHWVGTDCSVDTYTTQNGESLPVSIFQPSANTQYDIVIYFNGTCFVGMVNGYQIASYNKNPSNGSDVTAW